MTEDKEKEAKVFPVATVILHYHRVESTDEVFFLFMIQLGLLMKDK